ncbi:uncharacterized protein B0P05DRAFT_469485, partial [Gilbertella persicaria]|uniref:uncharacterized protein n=1 Tax=Gilbertella persicaria TaxID=101096 RepID=UPI00221FF4FC
FDTTANELVDLFQTLLDKNAAHEEHIKQLEQDVEKYASAATKVRDYEIRVEYLALKLEQVSEERDYFEKELNELAEKRPQQQHQHDIVIEEERKLQNQNNDAYIADILHVYEEISAENEPANQDNMEKQLVEHDKGIQITMMKYLADLETQRLETKNLQEIVLKQDELITKLEQKLDGQPADELLKEQVEVQRIELDNKRELLTQLLNEREDLLKRLNSQKRRSSIEFISHMLQDDSVHNNHRNSYSSTSSKSSGRGTPPLTAPPKQPLPPLPPVL